MQFKQFCLESLGHASYFIGLEQTGEAFTIVFIVFTKKSLSFAF